MKLSKQTEDIIAECRWTAEKLQNNFIGLKHFYLAYSKDSFRDTYDFKLTLTQKKELIKSLKGLKLGNRNDDLFPITKEFENALKTSNFYKWVLSDKEIKPIHILLSSVSEKVTYLQLLTDKGVKYGKFKKLMIDIHFNKLIKKQ